MSVHVTGWEDRVVPCPACHGLGILPTPDKRGWTICPRCGGTGYIHLREKTVIW